MLPTLDLSQAQFSYYLIQPFAPPCCVDWTQMLFEAKNKAGVASDVLHLCVLRQFWYHFAQVFRPP